MRTETKEKIKNWLKNPYNIAFLIILIFALGLRLYYFELTTSQPVWWDESEYLSAAKSFAGIVDYQLGEQRTAPFPFIISLLFRIGIQNEALLRLLVLFIPSIVVILLVYFCAKEMYEDRRIALISMALMAVLWEHLFYSNRFHTENFSLLFGLLGTYLLFKLYIKKEDLWILKHKYSLIPIMLCMLLSFWFRSGNVPFLITATIFILAISRQHLFKKKDVIYTLATIIPLGIIYLVYSYFKGSNFIAGILSYFHTTDPLAWNSFNIFHFFYESINPVIPSVLFYAFLVGVIILVYEFYKDRHHLLKLEENKDNLETKSNLFNTLIIISTLAVFIFIVRPYQGYEYRWFFPLVIGMFVLTAKAIISVSEYVAYFISESNKALPIIFILLLLLPGLYYEVEHADLITTQKLTSYAQVRDAALWMKEYSTKYDKILSISQPQTTFYSERKTDTYSGANTTSDLFTQINQEKPKFLTVSIFEKHPDFVFSLTQNDTKDFTPVKAFYLDPNNQQLALVVYQINYNK